MSWIIGLGIICAIVFIWYLCAITLGKRADEFMKKAWIKEFCTQDKTDKKVDKG